MHSIFKKDILKHLSLCYFTVQVVMKHLLPIAQELNKQATVLSIRGDVSENGMNRYFKRLAEGHYDLEDLEKRGEALHKFIQQAANEHQFSLDKIIFIGYSNGANIAIQLLLTHPDSYHQAVLYHPCFLLN